jgi:hypothetical protein
MVQDAMYQLIFNLMLFLFDRGPKGSLFSYQMPAVGDRGGNCSGKDCDCDSIGSVSTT